MDTDFDTLILIGNGYDVANSYKTKYSEFLESSQFKDLIVSNHLCKFINDRWIKNKRANINWVDLEMELYYYSHELTKKYGETSPEAHNQATEFEKDYNSLRAALKDYINGASSGKVNSELDSLSYSWIEESKNTHVVSFNYTQSPRSLFCNTDITKIPQADFIQVHGYVDYNEANKEDTIVLGIDESMKVSDLHSFIYKSLSPNIKNDRFEELVNKANRYIIYGCSIGKTDEWYFKKIFQQKNKIFEVYYFRDVTSINTRIMALSGNLSDFKQNNTLRIYNSEDLKNEIKRRQDNYNRIINSKIR